MAAMPLQGYFYNLEETNQFKAFSACELLVMLLCCVLLVIVVMVTVTKDCGCGKFGILLLQHCGAFLLLFFPC